MSKFKVGDSVKVVDKGFLYPRNDTISNKLIGESNKKAYTWEYGFSNVNNGDIGEIVAISFDGFDRKFILVNFDILNSKKNETIKRSIVFNPYGIEIIPQENYQCEKCLHKIVCKEKQNWAKAYDDHIRLRKESALFDEEPVCPCRIDESEYKTKEEWEKEYIDKMISDIKDIPLTTVKKSQDDIWNPLVKDASNIINSKIIKHNANDNEPIRIEFGDVSKLYNNIENLLLKR